MEEYLLMSCSKTALTLLDQLSIKSCQLKELQEIALLQKAPCITAVAQINFGIEKRLKNYDASLWKVNSLSSRSRYKWFNLDIKTSTLDFDSATFQIRSLMSS